MSGNINVTFNTVIKHYEEKTICLKYFQKSPAEIGIKMRVYKINGFSILGFFI